MIEVEKVSTKISSCLFGKQELAIQLAKEKFVKRDFSQLKLVMEEAVKELELNVR